MDQRHPLTKGLRPKHALLLLTLLLAGPVAGTCPDAPTWARTFYRQHYFFYAKPPGASLLKLLTPSFARALRAEIAYAHGEVGHLDYDPWLGAQDGEIAASPPPTFTARATGANAVTVTLHYLFVLEEPQAGIPQTVRLHLRRDDARACWRLGDFTTPVGESLVGVFTRR